MMKHCVCKKFSCRRGASVLIALLVFFLAALSGTIALTMSASNAGRYTHETDDQQSYLSVASAAKLILSKLEKYEIYLSTENSEDPTKSPTATNVTMTLRQRDTHSEVGVTNEMFFADTQFQANLIALTILDKSKLDPTYQYKDVRFRLTVDGVPSAGSVFVLLDMLNTTFTFYLWSEEGNIKNYQMKMMVDLTSDQTSQYQPENDATTGKPRYWYRTMKFDMTSVKYAVGGHDVPKPTETEGEVEGA